MDRLQAQLFRRPFRRFLRNKSKVLLQRVQVHQGGTPFYRIMRCEFIELSFQMGGYGETHRGSFYRSHSPMTKSMDPSMETMSLIICPGRIAGRIPRLT